MKANLQTFGHAWLAAVVIGAGKVAANADLIDYQMPESEAAWNAAAGDSVTNLEFDHSIDYPGNYYWESHGIGFGATGGGMNYPYVGYANGYYVPPGYRMRFTEIHGEDTSDLRLSFATPQRAISFSNIAWTNMEPIPWSGPRTFIHTEFFFQGIQVGSWTLNQGWLEGVPPPWMTPTFLGFVSDAAFDEVRVGILPQYGGTYHVDNLYLGIHGISFSTVPAPGALALLGVGGMWSRRRTRGR